MKRFAFLLLCLAPSLASAQQAPPVPERAAEPEGFIAEPAPITRAVLFADRHFGKGDLTNGFYIDYADMIPGAGWIAVGPGYRRWYGNDAMLLAGSAAISWNGFKTARARVELPRFAKSRLALGAEVKWLDYGAVDYYGVGPDTSEETRVEFGIRATHAVAHATLRPARWLAAGIEAGVLAPTLTDAAFGRTFPDTHQPAFVPVVLSIAADTRDFPMHPTRGALVRVAASHYDDRDTGAFTFRRYEGEAAGFVPIAGGRVVLALRGWVVSSDTAEGRSVPFYLLPSLGGANTLRSFANYRFHDRHLAVANAELRFAVMTHVDLAAFADAGNVAPRLDDLDLGKQSYGLGLRLHTRRQTFARMDVATGSEGWRVLWRLTDPLALTRLTRRTAAVPFVP